MVCFHLMNTVNCVSAQASLFALAPESLRAKKVGHEFS